MVRVPPDCPICCEPLTADLVAPSKCGHIYHQKCLRRWFYSPSGMSGRRCPVCRISCRASEVVRLQFELTRPTANADSTEEESQTAVLQTRLAMAKETVNALMRADTERVREFVELKDRVRLLQLEVSSHMLRASQAEARVSDFRSRLSRANACRVRLTTELHQVKKELLFQATRRQYLAEAATMSETRALEFFQERNGEDIRDALKLQHSVICELQSENAWLKSEKMKQRRHFRDAIERKDSVIQRLRTAAMTQSPPHSSRVAATLNGRRPPATRRLGPSTVSPSTAPLRVTYPGTPSTPTRCSDTNVARSAAQKIVECSRRTTTLEVGVKRSECVSLLCAVRVGQGSLIFLLLLLAAISWPVAVQAQLPEHAV